MWIIATEITVLGTDHSPRYTVSMATSQSTIEYILDQLSAIPDIRARKMFGEYALYAGDVVVALVCDDTLFVKITDAGKAHLGTHYTEGFAYPGAKASIQISGDLLEDREWLVELILLTRDHLPKAKQKKPSKK
jgi:DNA transformation protein and related proteins